MSLKPSRLATVLRMKIHLAPREVEPPRSRSQAELGNEKSEALPRLAFVVQDLKGGKK